MNLPEDKTLLFLPLLKYWVPIVSIIAVILNTSILLILVDMVMISINGANLRLNTDISTPTPMETAEIVRQNGNIILIIGVIISLIQHFRRNYNVKN